VTEVAVGQDATPTALIHNREVTKLTGLHFFVRQGEGVLVCHRHGILVHAVADEHESFLVSSRMRNNERLVFRGPRTSKLLHYCFGGKQKGVTC